VLFARGFTTGIIRTYHEEDEPSQGKVLTTSIWLVWVMGALLILLPLIFSTQVSSVMLGSPRHSGIVRLALAALVFEVSGTCASTYLIIHRKSLMFSAIGLMRLVLGLFLDIWLVLVMGIGLKGIFISSLITSAMAYVCFHYPVLKNYGLGFNRAIAAKLIAFQLPLLPGDMISFLSRQTERIMVRFMISLQSVGILEMAYKFPPLLNLVITIPFLRSWRTKSIEIGEQEDAPEIIGKMFTKYFYLMIFAGLIMAMTIENILKIITPPGFWAAASIARIEIITTIVMGSISSVEFGLVYRKKTGTLSKIMSITSILKIAFSMLMISSFGITGAAYSACICAILQISLVGVYSHRQYAVGWEYKKLLFIAISALAIAITGHQMELTGLFPTRYFRAEVFPMISDMLGSTFIGTWKSGKVLHILLEKQDQLTLLLSNTLLSLSFLAIVPIIWHAGTKRLLSNLMNKTEDAP
jgi:O-antigen/teichoic acid export membrane protein